MNQNIDYSSESSWVQGPVRMDWSRRAAKIQGRNWKSIRDDWFSVAPRPGTAGKAPATRIEESIVLQTTVADVTGNEAEEKTAPPGLREGVISEGVYLLHKAANALGGAQAKIERGFLSWSASSAYQSAFFAAQALLNLLGISSLQSGRETYLIDVWPPLKKKNISLSHRPIVVIKVQRIEHRELWLVFQRLLRITKGIDDVWPVDCVKRIISLETADFARQRNDLHYRHNRWTIPDDLHQLLTDAAFAVQEGGFADGEALNPERKDFSTILAIIIVQMASQLLRDLADVGPGWFRQEWELLEKWFQQPCHTLYQGGFPTIGVAIRPLENRGIVPS